MKRNLKNQKGITLVALVITIIVMLILVAVSVTVAINGGLFTKAKEAGNEWEDKSTQEAAGNILKVNVNGTETTMNIDSTINTLKERPKTPGTNPETPVQEITFYINNNGTQTQYTTTATTWSGWIETDAPSGFYVQGDFVCYGTGTETVAYVSEYFESLYDYAKVSASETIQHGKTYEISEY